MPIFIARAALVALAALLLPCGASAQSAGSGFAARPIRIIVPFPPGGMNDVIARAMADRMPERLGQPVLVENRAGGNTVIGTEYVAKAAPDGNTLLLSSVAHAINPSILKNLPYDSVKSFAHVSLICTSPFILMVRPSLPAQTFAEFVALAKAQPGKITYGSTGNGGSSHLMGEMLRSMAKIDIVHVPYKGVAPAIPDLLGGQIDATFVSYSTIGSYIRANRLRPLAVTSARRLAIMPDLPTIAESGYPGYDANPWWGIAAPAGTPEPVVAKLSAEFARIVRLPEVLQQFRERGVEAIGSTPAEAVKHLVDDVALWAKIVKDSGAKVE